MAEEHQNTQQPFKKVYLNTSSSIEHNHGHGINQNSSHKGHKHHHKENGCCGGPRKQRYASRLLCFKKFWVGFKPQLSVAYFTITLNLGLSVLYFTCMAPYIAENLSKNLNYVGLFIAIVDFYCLTQAIFRDPGVIKLPPKSQEIEMQNVCLTDNADADNTVQDIQQDVKINVDLNSETKTESTTSTADSQTKDQGNYQNLNQENGIHLDDTLKEGDDQEKEVLNTNASFELKDIPLTTDTSTLSTTEETAQHPFRQNKIKLDIDFYKTRECTTCKIERPPFASHCSLCGYCIKGFDHHCMFMANCVGVRNLQPFYGFVVFGFFIAMFWLYTSVFMMFSLYYNEELVRQKVYDNYGWFYAQLICFSLLLCCGPCMKKTFVLCMLTIYILLALIANIIFYNGDLPPSKNLVFPFILAHIAFGLGLWSFGMGLSMTINTIKGVTTKEMSAIRRKVSRSDWLKDHGVTLADALRNFVNFVLYKIPDSEMP